MANSKLHVILLAIYAKFGFVLLNLNFILSLMAYEKTLLPFFLFMLNGLFAQKKDKLYPITAYEKIWQEKIVIPD
ncbi:hypothetical protein ACQ9BO_08200 [Flavobacterium sp. P21]|uniref:hypothetical protein n=1 Tax=Flavobacterium sp. P21 TaxID=3423948 RepID=UPI003D677406